MWCQLIHKILLGSHVGVNFVTKYILIVLVVYLKGISNITGRHYGSGMACSACSKPGLKQQLDIFVVPGWRACWEWIISGTFYGKENAVISSNSWTDLSRWLGPGAGLLVQLDQNRTL